MTLVPDITLQFLKWRYQSHSGAKRAYEWVREDIERLGWHGLGRMQFSACGKAK